VRTRSTATGRSVARDRGVAQDPMRRGQIGGPVGLASVEDGGGHRPGRRLHRRIGLLNSPDNVTSPAETSSHDGTRRNNLGHYAGALFYDRVERDVPDSVRRAPQHLRQRRATERVPDQGPFDCV
jgi:hypothetical protein